MERSSSLSSSSSPRESPLPSPIISPAIAPRSLGQRDNNNNNNNNIHNNNARGSLQHDLSLGFIGAGQMAQAFIKGLLRAQAVTPEQIWVSNRSESKLSKLTARGIHPSTDNILVAKSSNVLILAVKPAVLPAVCAQLSPHVSPSHLVISIAAGVPISAIEALLPSHARVVRVMPNTPALVGAMAAGYSLGRHANSTDGSLVESLLSPLGRALAVDEKWIDAVTGLAGSGPAYVFMMIEAMADGGVRAGLSREVAQTLAAQTVLGAAKMVLDTGKHPAQLKDQVASPGGTTIAGLHALETGNFRGTVMNAVYAASNRATELAHAAAHVAANTTSHLAQAGAIPVTAQAASQLHTLSRPSSPHTTHRTLGSLSQRVNERLVDRNLEQLDSNFNLDSPARPA